MVELSRAVATRPYEKLEMWLGHLRNCVFNFTQTLPTVLDGAVLDSVLHQLHKDRVDAG